LTDNETINVKDSEIEKFAIEIFLKYGVPFEDAAIVAKHLAAANLRGVDTHGVIRLKGYIDRIKNGGNNPKPDIKVVKDNGFCAVMDGDNSLGQLGGFKAMELAINKAEKYGIGIVTMRNSNHYGVAGYYAMMPLQYDMIGISMTNVLACMAPTGGTKAKIGNDPLAIAFPASNYPAIVLDFATSKSSWGKALLCKQKNEPLPVDCFTDSDGNPTTDAEKFLAGGTLLPVAGYKGYGLALVISLFCSLLSGGKFDIDLPHLYNKLNEPGGNSFLMAAIKIDGFLPSIEFKKRTDEIISSIKDTPLVQNIDQIYLPGEKEFDEESKRKKMGIPLNKSLVIDLLKMGQDLKVDTSQYNFFKNLD
jgi:LDH2 family malate/lactate/ureidoglycolate dehydrogenase